MKPKVTICPPGPIDPSLFFQRYAFDPKIQRLRGRGVSERPEIDQAAAEAMGLAVRDRFEDLPDPKRPIV